MNPASRIAAVVLAAGRSSRMGTSKPLLPLGSVPVIERVIESICRADVGDIVVVTGHAAHEVAPALAALPVRRAHNAGYDSGMFSSVRTGVAALRDDAEAFFILPVDYPLVRPEVLHRLIAGFRDGGHGILHPCCCGLRGHPPLLAGRFRETILQANDGDNLRDFLERSREKEFDVEVEDLTILMDMDTAEDYRRIARFAGFLDRAAAPGRAADDHLPTMVPEDALHLLSLLETPDQVVRHCQAVTAVGEALMKALGPHQPHLDAALVSTACLLHDMARTAPKHALVGRNLLANLGLGRLAEVVGAHMVLPPQQRAGSLLTEEQLVYLADKLVIDDRIGGLEEKAAHALRGREDDPAALEGARARMLAARLIADKVESILGRRLEEVLP